MRMFHTHIYRPDHHLDGLAFDYRLPGIMITMPHYEGASTLHALCTTAHIDHHPYSSTLLAIMVASCYYRLSWITESYRHASVPTGCCWVPRRPSKPTVMKRLLHDLWDSTLLQMFGSRRSTTYSTETSRDNQNCWTVMAAVAQSYGCFPRDPGCSSPA